MGLLIDIDKKQLRELEAALDGSLKMLPKQVSTAINKTRTKAASTMAKSVVKELAVTQKTVRDAIDKGRRSTPKTLRAMLTLRAGERLPLKQFKPRQTRKGVSYKVSKTEGRKTLKSGFIVQSLGSHVFARSGPKRRVRSGVNKGRMKQAIYKKYGASPWGVYVKQDVDPEVRKQINEELRKQIAERIRFLRLKQQGVI